MSACAGSSTDASRANRSGMSPSKFGSCACWEELGIVPDHKSRILRHFAGMVLMDRARQDWVYEHAETGIPSACKLHGSRGSPGSGVHKLSAIGSPQPTARSACCFVCPPWFAAFKEGSPSGGRCSSVPQGFRPDPTLPSQRVSIQPCRRFRSP